MLPPRSSLGRGSLRWSPLVAADRWRFTAPQTVATPRVSHTDDRRVRTTRALPRCALAVVALPGATIAVCDAWLPCTMHLYLSVLRTGRLGAGDSTQVTP